GIGYLLDTDDNIHLLIVLQRWSAEQLDTWSQPPRCVSGPLGPPTPSVVVGDRVAHLDLEGPPGCYGPRLVTTADEVRLVVPALPEFLRLARVTAAGLAGRLGFSYDEVEDLRLAIDELCFGLTGPTGRHGTVELRYLIVDEGLVVEGQGHFVDD